MEERRLAGKRYIRDGHKQKLIAFASPALQMIDEEAEAVRDQTLSDGYSASEPLDDSDQAQRHDQTEIQAWRTLVWNMLMKWESSM